MTRRTHLDLEPLEPRENPSLMVGQAGTVLYVDGGNLGEVGRIITVSGGLQVQEKVGNGPWQNVGQVYSGITKIEFKGNGGDDKFDHDPASFVPLVAYGGAGNDELKGGAAGDVLRGEAGNDKLYGGKGDDTLDGGDGVDYLNDTIVVLPQTPGTTATLWEGGNDKMYGGSGRDVIYAGSGNDYLDGGQDKSFDQLYGQGGKDTFVKEPNGQSNLDAPQDYLFVEGDIVINPI